MNSISVAENNDLCFVPKWMLWAQALCFSVLYAIWALPETILIRHICLILGAIIGLYEIYLYRDLLKQKSVTSNWFLVGLFLWVLFHLIFLSKDFELQYHEFISTWKRIFLGWFFALGFGVALGNSFLSATTKKRLGLIIVLGMISPIILYFIKYFLTNYALKLGWTIPEGLRLYYSSAPYYIPKTVYISFLLPILSLAIMGFLNNFINQKRLGAVIFFYLFLIFGVFVIFYIENIKNGFFYSLLLVLIILPTLFKKKSTGRLSHLLIIVSLIVLLGAMTFAHFKSNQSWRNLISDVRVGIETKKFQHWKYSGGQGYPLNENGHTVSITVYERVAYAKEAILMIIDNPLGFGLIEGSFGRFSKNNWPDTNLNQAHSGWIDFTLGIGIPGSLLLLFSLLFLARQHLKNIRSHQTGKNDLESLYLNTACWSVYGLAFAWFTTELSQKIFLDEFIFLIGLASSLMLRKDSRVFMASKA